MVEWFLRAPGNRGSSERRSAVPGTRYVNVRTGNIVEARSKGSAVFTVATVTDDGYGRPRRVPATSFHKNYLTGDGKPHSSGYVPVNTLPSDHPHAMRTEIDRMELLDNLDKLSPEELARLIDEQQRLMKEAKALVDRAKQLSRERREGPGTEVYGDIAVVYSRNDRFDEQTARENLTPEDLAKISIPKPDAAVARAVFRNDPKKLQACMKSHGLKVEVRPATDGDRLKVLAEKGAQETGASDEVFTLDEPPF
jgi:hypothetical protein